SYSKEWLLNTLENWQGKAMVLSTIFLLILFGCSFYIAPSGRSAESISLEKKLNENKKIISSEEKPKEMTKDSSTTKESSKEEDKEEQKSEEKEVFSLSKEETSYLQDLNVTAIGDSLLLSAAPEMQKIFPKSIIDAEVGRQFIDSEPIFEKMTKDKKLGDVVVVVLGTNGSFTSKDVSQVMTFADGKEVFFVNTMVQRPWQKAVNDELNKTQETYKNAHVIDWKDYSLEKYDWFDVDDVHLTPAGAENFSTLVGKEIYKTLNK
ncbi:MAG: hypothetical protein LBV11_11050, partial [Bacillus cereus]|nr:hypothetical protein [Bacillus cereus]